MDIKVSQTKGKVPVTIIEPRGDVDGANYRCLIDKAHELWDQGVRDVLVDLRQVPYMSSSGLVALHNIAVMLRGEEPPDPAGSWAALRAFDRERQRGRQAHLKLLGPRDKVGRVLEMAGFTRFIEVHTDLDVALASF
jgi:anti-anti-sigma regulatory factor